jgi:hypothetical protein
MGQFNSWQRQEIDAVAFDENGEMQTYRFKRIMVEYAQMLFSGMNQEDMRRDHNIWEQDIKNWHIEYPRFSGYLKALTACKTLAMQINPDWAMQQLWLAAMGKKVLDNNQLNAIKLILQAKGVLAAGSGKKAANPITTFTIEEKGEGK